MITADYSGTAKAELTSALARVDIGRRSIQQLQKPTQSFLGGSGVPGARASKR